MLSTDAISALAQAGGSTARALPREGELEKGDAAAFRDFEALLLGEVMKGAQRTSFGKEHALTGGSAGKMYREMLMDALAAGVTEAGGIGLADSMASAAKRGVSEQTAADGEDEPRG